MKPLRTIRFGKLLECIQLVPKASLDIVLSPRSAHGKTSQRQPRRKQGSTQFPRTYKFSKYITAPCSAFVQQLSRYTTGLVRIERRLVQGPAWRRATAPGGRTRTTRRPWAARGTSTSPSVALPTPRASSWRRSPRLLVDELCEGEQRTGKSDACCTKSVE